MLKKIQYNSPVVLTFALLSLAALLLGKLTGGWTTAHLFCVYRSSLLDPLTYVRLFCHVLGHSGYQHYIGNMLLFLVVGPQLEEKYGSRTLLWLMVITAGLSGVVQMAFFPKTSLLGASGIVFMMIALASLSGAKNGGIPLTLIFVLIFYIGGEIVDGLTLDDNVSQITHVIGGLCGAAAGFFLLKNKKKRKR